MKQLDSKEILHNRAKQLSNVIEKSQYSAESIEVLEFEISKERYAFETKYIKEVQELKDYTPLPNAPAYILGLYNLRRRIISITDLRVLFGLPKVETTDRKIIILEHAGIEIAFLADDIKAISHIRLDHIQPALPTITGIKLAFLKGVTAESLVILDGGKLMTSKHIMVNEEVVVQ